jgi:protein-S-isoprenylcysteine O-methyltransferase Ste14
MGLIETFEQQGQFLFRWRGQVPLLFVLITIPVGLSERESWVVMSKEKETILLLFSIVFAILGHLFRALAVGRRQVQTSGRNRSHQVASFLNTKDLYSVVRHPLYFGNFLIWVGLTIYFGIFWFAVLVWVFYAWYYERIMFTEEQFLRQKFGQKFTDWSNRVPALFPSFKNYQPSGNQLSWRIILKNEYPGAVSTLSTFWFIALMRYCIVHKSFIPEMSQIYFALFILVFGVTFKLLKKYTGLFYEND